MTVTGHVVREGGQPHLHEWVLEAAPFQIKILHEKPEKPPRLTLQSPSGSCVLLTSQYFPSRGLYRYSSITCVIGVLGLEELGLKRLPPLKGIPCPLLTSNPWKNWLLRCIVALTDAHTPSRPFAPAPGGLTTPSRTY